MKNKIIAILLLTVILLGTVACASTKNGTETQQQSSEVPSEAETTSAETVNERYLIKENLPDKKFGGYSFRILTRDADHHLKEVVAEDENGETINDAVYKRNLTIEEKHDITIDVLKKSEDDETVLTAFFKKSVLSGDDDFDLALPHTIYAGIAAAEGVMYDWHSIPYIDFSKPWWNKILVDELTINKKLYLAASDFCISAIDYTWSMVFNSSMCENYGITDMYDTVSNGDWTIDKLATYAKLPVKDLNGDGAYDFNDQFGYTTHYNSEVLNWMFALNQKVTAMNSDGYPELVINTDKMADIVNKVYSLLYEDNKALVVNDAVEAQLGTDSQIVAISSKFAADQTMFAGLCIYAIERLRNMESDFGIIPFPKYDAAQEAYYTHVDGHSPLMALPKTLKNPERTGIIIEALSAESYREVVPAVMDIVLQSKFARDTQSYEMLQRILDGRVYTFGYIYDGWNGMQWTLVNLMSAKSSDFASYYAKNEAIAIKQYDSIMKAYSDIV